MFVGHYAVAFVLKKKSNQIPLWELFLSVQLVDILAFLFVLLGVERVAYNPSPNPFLRTTIEYVPYSHSLFTNLIIALAVFLFFWRYKNKVWGLMLSIGILSHWFLDVLVHVHDIPLFFDRVKVGLGLWNYPWIALGFEAILLILAGCYVMRSSGIRIKYLVLIILLLISYLPIFFAPESEATPAQASIVSLGLYSLFTALSYWADRKKEVV
ncbi:hypothetical protein ACFL3Q_09265 [Planctomycetota bacterium]